MKQPVVMRRIGSLEAIDDHEIVRDGKEYLTPKIVQFDQVGLRRLSGGKIIAGTCEELDNLACRLDTAIMLPCSVDQNAVLRAGLPRELVMVRATVVVVVTAGNGQRSVPRR